MGSWNKQPYFSSVILYTEFFFKVSGRKQFILATFNKKKMLKVSQLNLLI